MSVRVNINQGWDNKQLKQLDVGTLALVLDIDRRAKTLAPVDTGALANSGKIKRNGEADYTLTFGSGKVPYARKRYYENEKNPQTKGYLGKAADSVVRGNTTKYFKGL